MRTVEPHDRGAELVEQLGNVVVDDGGRVDGSERPAPSRSRAKPAAAVVPTVLVIWSAAGRPALTASSSRSGPGPTPPAPPRPAACKNDWNMARCPQPRAGR